MADPKKIRLTFLWSDRAAVEQDFGAGYSKLLADWAGKFFGGYGLALDIAPQPADGQQEAYKYSLADANGHNVDFATAAERLAIYDGVMRPVQDELGVVSDESRALFSEIFDKQREAEAALRKFNTIPLTDWPAQAVTLGAAVGGIVLRTAEREAKEARYWELIEKMKSINQLYAFEKRSQNFDLPLRLAIGDKVIQAMELPEPRTPAAAVNLSIRSEERLKVVFCRFHLSPALAKAGKAAGPQPHGLTLSDARPYNSVNGQYFFNGPLIMVNILRPERITLAHEMVHAAGRGHRPDFDRLKSLADIIDGFAWDRVNQKVIIPSFVERVEGAYYDGPADDILNYNTKGKDPEKVKLYPEDEKRMKGAYFVRTSAP